MQDFGSYRLEKLLGRGGMGEVWLARHSFLRRDAAVKLILPELLEGASHSERRHMQESSTQLPVRCRREMHDTVEHVVADEESGGVRHFRGQPGRDQRADDGFDR